MEFFGWLSAVIIALLVIGFGIGFWRNWQKALVRLLCLGAIILFATLVTPSISQLFVDRFTDGSIITIAGTRLDITELLKDVLDENMIADLTVANGTTNALAVSILHVAINLAIFFALFILLSILSLIIYWIVFSIVGSRYDRKLREEDLARLEKQSADKTVPVIEVDKKSSASYWILKVVSGFMGLVSMVFILFAFMTPVFGVMNICNRFVDERTANGAGAYSYIDIKKANASGITDSLIGGKLYYKDDKTIGKLENYIEIYSEIKNNYDHSVAGFIFNNFGISKLGTLNFNQLTDVTHGGLNFNVTDELITLIKIYNIYKEEFVQKKFDITNNNDLDAVLKIYNTAQGSEISKGYITDLLPAFSERWSNDKPFLGVENPVKGEYEKLFKSVISIFKTQDLDIITNNFTVLIDAIKIANNNELITLINSNGDILNYLETNKTLFNNEILNMTNSTEFKNNIPEIFGNLVEIIYNNILEDDGNFETNQLSPSEIEAIDFNVEAENFQSLVNNLASVINAIKNKGDSLKPSSGNLTKLGRAIDLARISKIAGKPFEILMKDLIVSDKINIDAEVKKTLQTAFIENWEKSLEEYSFEVMLSTLEKTAMVAENIINGNANFAELEDMLAEVIVSDSVKGTIKDALNSGVIESLFDGDDNRDAKVLSSILSSFVTSENSSKETLKDDINAVSSIIDLANAARNEESLLPNENTQDYADQLVADLTTSKLTLEILEKANNNEEGYSEIKLITLTTNSNEKNCLKNSIDNIDNDETKELLYSLFDIDII